MVGDLSRGVVHAIDIVTGEERAVKTGEADEWRLLLERARIPMAVVLVVFYPLVISLNGIGNFCLRLMGVRRQEAAPGQSYTPEELQIIVEESAEGGAMRAEAGSILSELLEFGDLTAGEVMVPRVRVVGIPVGTMPDEIRRMLLAHHHTRYAIYERDLDHVVGMLHVKDLLRRILAGEPLKSSSAWTYTYTFQKLPYPRKDRALGSP